MPCLCNQSLAENHHARVRQRMSNGPTRSAAGAASDGATRCRITARFVDRLSRQVFPLAFVLFNVVYWVVYTVSFSDGEEDM